MSRGLECTRISALLGDPGGAGRGTDNENEVPKIVLEPAVDKRTLGRMLKSCVRKEDTKGHVAGPRDEGTREVSGRMVKSRSICRVVRGGREGRHRGKEGRCFLSRPCWVSVPGVYQGGPSSLYYTR